MTKSTRDKETLRALLAVDEPIIRPTAKELLPETGNAFTELQLVLVNYLEKSQASEINGYMVRAEYIVDDLALDLELYAMHPGFCRQTLTANNVKIVYAYDLEETWSRSSTRGFEDVLPENEYTLRMECDFAALAWTYNEKGVVGLSRKPDFTQDGETYFVIENEVLLADAGVPVLHYINANTGLEEWREARFDMLGEPSIIIVDYEYQSSDDASITSMKGYTVNINGEPKVKAKFTKFRTNVGLMSVFFKKPKE
ncbi:MAG: hypothetical protein ACSHYA_11770 [Opitutaceae bacterium]